MAELSEIKQVCDEVWDIRSLSGSGAKYFRIVRDNLTISNFIPGAYLINIVATLKPDSHSDWRQLNQDEGCNGEFDEAAAKG